MLYPSIDRLLQIIDSKYKLVQLVHVVSIRAKEMLIKHHYQMKESEYLSKKEIGRSLEEVEKGLVRIKEN